MWNESNPQKSRNQYKRFLLSKMERTRLVNGRRRSLSRGSHLLVPGLSHSLTMAILLSAAAMPSRFLISSAPDERKQEIQLIAQSFCRQLGVSQSIHVVVLSNNPRLASVEFLPGRTDAFQMIFEQGFLDSLDRHELIAAVAHEVGHAWIFTHFPYLQTEALANRQALKLVSRSDLENLYHKVWTWKGEQGDLDKVLERANLKEKRSASATDSPEQAHGVGLKLPER